MEEHQEPSKKSEFDMWRVVNFGFEMGFIIAIPLIVFGFLGKWLDARYGTKPAFALTAVLLSIGTTVVWLTKRFRDLMK